MVVFFYSVSVACVDQRSDGMCSPIWIFTLSQTSHGFYTSAVQVLKTLLEKEKLLITSNFSFSHSVFYSFGELDAIFIKFETVVCKLFWFGKVQNLLFGKELNDHKVTQYGKSPFIWRKKLKSLISTLSVLSSIHKLQLNCCLEMCSVWKTLYQCNNLTWSNWKHFQNTKKRWDFLLVFGRLENNIIKGKNAGYQHFS